MPRRISGALGVLALAACLAPAQARAYLDPSTGSAIFQMVVATALGSLFVIRSYWKKITGFFSRESALSTEATVSQETASADKAAGSPMNPHESGAPSGDERA